MDGWEIAIYQRHPSIIHIDMGQRDENHGQCTCTTHLGSTKKALTQPWKLEGLVTQHEGRKTRSHNAKTTSTLVCFRMY